VSLNWTPSVSPGIIGYNIYEGTVSGGPYVRLWSLAATPAYEDRESTLVPGSTQYYVVTAVDDTGLESSYSNEASVLIPTP
jgi:fibronectin type 3 domain-containing protein